MRHKPCMTKSLHWEIQKTSKEKRPTDSSKGKTYANTLDLIINEKYMYL